MTEQRITATALTGKESRKLAFAITEAIEAVRDDLFLSDRVLAAALRLASVAGCADLPAGGKPLAPALEADLNRTADLIEAQIEGG